MRSALGLACLVRTPERTPARRLDPPLPSSFYLLKTVPNTTTKAARGLGGRAPARGVTAAGGGPGRVLRLRPWVVVVTIVIGVCGAGAGGDAGAASDCWGTYMAEHGAAFSSRASTHTNAFPLPHTQTPKHAQHDTALDAAEGRLLLCPSDPPLRWVAALADATPEVRIHLHTCACMFVCIIYIRTRRARREGHRQTTTNTYDFNHRRSGASGRCAGGRRPSCAPCRTWRCQVRI